MKECKKCGRYPFCMDTDELENAIKEECNKFVKRSVETKLTKIDNEGYHFEEVKKNEK